MGTSERGCRLRCPKCEVEEAALFHAGLLHVSASHCEFSSILLWKKTPVLQLTQEGGKRDPEKPLGCGNGTQLGFRRTLGTGQNAFDGPWTAVRTR
ncbi:hypothetical protein MDA_GLEAN10013746 [Myotis davidii]|uniref:Uncharacterized protein n=1 Tax=Myotis davidii TaxID=225400 RepID=L5MHX5_MYODS|nr:hypothetical protein MDA_GLEAN10013746 [Myotis davidii]